MNTFNNNTANGNGDMASTGQNSFSDELMGNSPLFGEAERAEYEDGLENVDFNYSNDETMGQAQTEPARTAPDSANIDPRLISIDAAQQPIDSPTLGLYNDIQTPNPTQGIFNGSNLLVESNYQPNIPHPFLYQQRYEDNLLEQNALNQQLLEKKLEEKRIEQQRLERERAAQMSGFQQAPFQQTPTQQMMPLQEMIPQQTPYLQPNFQQNLGWGLQQPLVNPTVSNLEAGRAYTYRNQVLNSFADPSVLLRTIDQFDAPFAPYVQNALEKEASNREDMEIIVLSDSEPEIKPEIKTEMEIVVLTDSEPEIKTETPSKAGRKTRNNNSSKIKKSAPKPKNKRQANQDKILAIAAKIYKDIPSKPASWGPINPNTGRPTFEYTKYGELALDQSFTTAQISEYLANHPAHGTLPGGGPDTKHSGLKLWVQYAGADSNKRYPSPSVSTKCRFAKCTRGTRTIAAGEPRICFDEQRFPDFPTNPYHNAGYVHLYCLEKEFDFPQLCRDFNIGPDTREFSGGDINRCAITRDFPAMEKVVNDFIRKSKPWAKFNNEGMRPANWYPESLNSRLVEYHLAHQPKTVQNARDKRGGNSIDLYRGDLALWNEIEQARKAKPSSKRKQTTKRKRADEQEEDSEDEDAEGSDDEDEDVVVRPIKRARRS